MSVTTAIQRCLIAPLVNDAVKHVLKADNGSGLVAANCFCELTVELARRVCSVAVLISVVQICERGAAL